MTEVMLPEQGTLEEAASEEPLKPTTIWSEEFSAFACAAFACGGPVLTVNSADGSLMQAIERPEWRFGVESDDTAFNSSKVPHTKAVGDFERLFPLLTRIRWNPTHFNVLVDEGHPDLAARARVFLAEFNVCPHERNGMVRVTEGHDVPDDTLLVAEQTTLRRLISFQVEPADKTVAPMTVSVYRHLDGFEYAERMGQVAVVPPTMKMTVDQVDLAKAAIDLEVNKRYAYTKIHPGSDYYVKEQGEKMTAAHREYGARFISSKKPGFNVSVYGKDTMQVTLTKWQEYALGVDGLLDHVRKLDDKKLSWFASSPGDWTTLELLAIEGLLRIDPALNEPVEEMLREAYRTTTPALSLPVAMRLGWLTEQPKIVCRASDESKEFVEGRVYTVHKTPRSREDEFYVDEEDKKSGRLLHKRKKRNSRWMEFTITNDRGHHHSFTDGDPGDIRYLAEHFIVPNPGSTASRYEKETLEAYAVVESVEEKFLKPRGLSLRTFQKCDLAVALVKQNVVISWEMGLGKTWAGVLYILCQWEKGTKKNALIVTNKDLIPQWVEITQQMCGGTLKVIDSTPPKNLSALERAEWHRNQLSWVRSLGQRIKRGEETGVWITSYYDLAQGGKRLNDREDPYVFDFLVEPDPETRQMELKAKWSVETCPWCGAYLGTSKATCSGRAHVGTGRRSRTRCGYSQWNVKVPTFARLLSDSFETIVTDEGTAIANESQQADALRGMTARHKLLMTGTPIKNYIAQAHNLLGWALGHETKRYRYAYGEPGRKAFVDNYGVFEWTRDEDGKWGSGKQVGATTNTSELWKEMSCNIITRRVEESGENLPPLKFHLIEAPLGYYQREQMDTWRVKFPHWYAQEHPEAAIVQSGGVYQHFLGLGIDAKFNWACVLPTGDDDHQWTKVPVSDFTPMAMKSLETTMKLVKMGRKVVVGSDTPLAVEFLAAELRTKGLKVTCLSKNGTSIPPKERAEEIAAFRRGEADVLCATVGAIQMGHNLEVASAMVLHGLPWDYTTFHQFQKRIRRLTSKDPIDVFVILPGEENATVVGRKWAVLKDKTAGIAKALYGEFDAIEEEKPDTAKILADLIANGIPITGDEVKEEEVEEAWRRFPMVSSVEVDEDFVLSLCVEEVFEDDAEHLDPRQYVAPFITAGDVADSLERFFLGWRTASERNAQLEEERIRELEEELRAETDRVIAELEQQFEGLDEIFLSEAEDESLTCDSCGEAYDSDYGDGWMGKCPSCADAAEPEETSSADDEVSPTAVPPVPQVMEPVAPASPLPVVALVQEEVEPEPLSEAEAVPPPAEVPAPVLAPSPLSQLREAKELLDLGILDQGEFNDLKTVLLARLKEAA